MQRCPKCGYRETRKIDGPGILWFLAFFLLYFVWMLGDYSPRPLRSVGLAALILFIAGAVWKVLKLKSSNRTAEEQSAQHPANSH